MRYTQNFNIVFTFVCLWLAIFLPADLELYLGCFFILSIGLLHGSNDIKIIKKVYEQRKISFRKTLLLYIGVVLFGAVMFYILPLLALVLFILVSGYHFGEQHFHDTKPVYNKYLRLAMFLTYGCLVIFMVLYANADKSLLIISQITDYILPSFALLYGLIISALFFAVLFLIHLKSIKSPVREIFNLLVLFIVFNTASLIWGFAIYFVLWHALPSLIDQVAFLSSDINKKSIVGYLKSSLVYWLASIAGLVLFFVFLIKNTEMIFAIFFSFLAAITFPHVIVMSRIFKH